MTIYCLRPHEGPHECVCCHVSQEEWDAWSAVRDLIAKQLSDAVFEAGIT